MALSADEIRLARAAIARRQADADAVLDCPRCGAAGLVLTDRSARPHAEWYHLCCAGCGLDETLHIPLGPPTIGGLD
jgi:transcription elongation factor Elf1